MYITLINIAIPILLTETLQGTMPIQSCAMYKPSMQRTRYSIHILGEASSRRMLTQDSSVSFLPGKSIRFPIECKYYCFSKLFKKQAIIEIYLI